MQSGRINSLLTAILQSKGKHIILESESICTSEIFSIDGESHIFVYLKGRAKIYVQLLKLIPRGHNSSWPLLWLSIKHALKDVPFPLSATLIWTAELPRPGPWIGFSLSNMITSSLVFLLPLPPAIEYVFLNNHLIQSPIIFCELV